MSIQSGLDSVLFFAIVLSLATSNDFDHLNTHTMTNNANTIPKNAITYGTNRPNDVYLRANR